MRLNCYAIFDTAAAVYQRPIFAQSDGEVIRSFTDVATDADHFVGKHPEDYSLHRIGVWDDQNAKFSPEQPECIATALELVAKTRNVNRDNVEKLDTKIKAGLTQ